MFIVNKFYLPEVIDSFREVIEPLQLYRTAQIAETMAKRVAIFEENSKEVVLKLGKRFE